MLDRTIANQHINVPENASPSNRGEYSYTFQVIVKEKLIY